MIFFYKGNIYFFNSTKNIEKFGGFRYFSYLCALIKKPWSAGYKQAK